jgi:hypothetical protein
MQIDWRPLGKIIGGYKDDRIAVFCNDKAGRSLGRRRQRRVSVLEGRTAQT